MAQSQQSKVKPNSTRVNSSVVNSWDSIMIFWEPKRSGRPTSLGLRFETYLACFINSG